MDLGLSEIRELVRILQDGGLSELAVEAGSVKVHLKRGGVALPVAPVESVVSASPALPAAAPAPAPVAVASDNQVVRSPMVGTFYRSPSPEAPPFVEEGAVVTPGQCLCIIEAMKLMNEIEAEQGGRVVKVLVANGALVEYGQPLFELAR
ncbi:MAG: acetyl-CoA carboxylase biotin carboxyl carrier protein [Candidatus Sericytochromatia bacterium]|nr:acetyl-CoA carboxylase biotin carboxyl carrier protein [Candidatus Sericytochromatia bacterium]